MKDCHARQIDYSTELHKHGIEDKIFYDVLQSRLRPGVLSFRTQAELIRGLSKINQVRPNIWHLEPSRYNERHGKPKKLIDPRRDNYKP